MANKVKYRNWIFLWIIVLSMACTSQSTTDLPKDIIPPESMQKIIYDINLAETMLLRRNQPALEQAAQRKSDLEFILKKHEVSDRIFNLSYDFYSQNPEEFKAVLEGAIEMAEKEMQNRNNEDSLSKGKN